MNLVWCGPGVILVALNAPAASSLTVRVATGVLMPGWQNQTATGKTSTLAPDR
jgi:hypothetical protein